MSGIDQAKLAALQAKAGALRIGGKGTPRRKVISRPANQGDDKKLQAQLKKLNVQPIQGVEEVNMFKDDGNVLHFTAPKVHAAMGSNTFAIYGQGVDKELTELVPGILNQLGPDAIANLRKIAESYQNQQGGATAVVPEADEDDDEMPELIDSSAAPAIPTESNLEDIN